MLLKEKILFSKEECDKIISYANEWYDREISVDYNNKRKKINLI